MLLENGVNPVVNKNLQNGLDNVKNDNVEVYEKSGDEPRGKGKVGSFGHKLAESMNRGRYKEHR